MLGIFFQGFIVSAVIIFPLGPQNIFVLHQGIRRQYHIMSAIFCALSDIVLICSGIFGGSALLSTSPLLLTWVTWGGVIFLIYYGFTAFRTALSMNTMAAGVKMVVQNRWQILLILLTVTWLNPHAWLDAFVILGSVGSQLVADARLWFAFGAVIASVSWFFALALLAARFAPTLNRPQVQRIIHGMVGILMWGIALRLVLVNYS